MKRSLFIIFLFGLNLHLFAQINSYSDLVHNGNSYDAFIIKIDKESLKRFDIVENKSKLTHSSFMNMINKDSSIFAINAGISDSACKPLGYYVKNSIQIKPVNQIDGKGNFYLKPNGALLLMDSDAVICESSKIANFKNVKYGIQSGPLLLNNGSINPQFNSSSTNKNIRCGVGTFTKNNESYIVFCISNLPVTFYDFTLLFDQKFKCNNALCLESSGCVMNLPYIPKASKNDLLMICNYLNFHTH